MAIRVPRPFRTPLTEAEFSYTVDQDVIKVVDLNLGSNSITNDAERVLRKIEQWQPGLIARCRIIYRDSRGIWDGMEWDGQEVRFFPIRETDERAAERKLRQLRPPSGRSEPLWVTFQQRYEKRHGKCAMARPSDRFGACFSSQW
jgi:hypothetical protein